MKKILVVIVSVFLSVVIFGQTTSTPPLPFRMEEITSPMFPAAIEKAGGVCIIPLGIIEKHGPHLPLGTDLFESREIAFRAAGKEYAIVFPPYYFGQIFEARHQPGTISYSNELMWKILEESCNELSRNGIKKIVLLNGHGGNGSFLQFFCQSQLSSRRDYIVVLYQESSDQALDKEINSLKKAKLDGHAGEEETSMMSVIRPDLVDLNAITTQSGLDQARLKQLRNGYTGIWWFARYPNHFASDVAQPDKKLGELLLEKEAKQLAGLVKFLKSDSSIEKLMDEFYTKSENPSKK